MRTYVRRVAPVLVAGVVILTASGCGNDEAQSPGGSGVPETLHLSSDVLHDGKAIKPPYACSKDGDAGTSPPLSWRDASSGTKAYAVTMIDTDADDFVHWGVLNLPPAVHDLAAGQRSLPKGVIVVRNGFGDAGYGAPCPPSGSPHHYVVTVWALKRPVQKLADLPEAALARGRVTVTYQR